jgi:hypothetical protein
MLLGINQSHSSLFVDDILVSVSALIVVTL